MGKRRQGVPRNHTGVTPPPRALVEYAPGMGKKTRESRAATRTRNPHPRSPSQIPRRWVGIRPQADRRTVSRSDPDARQGRSWTPARRSAVDLIPTQATGAHRLQEIRRQGRRSEYKIPK